MISAGGPRGGKLREGREPRKLSGICPIPQEVVFLSIFYLSSAPLVLGPHPLSHNLPLLLVLPKEPVSSFSPLILSRNLLIKGGYEN